MIYIIAQGSASNAADSAATTKAGMKYVLVEAEVETWHVLVEELGSWNFVG
jgi:hypothetical protein